MKKAWPGREVIIVSSCDLAYIAWAYWVDIIGPTWPNMRKTRQISELSPVQPMFTFFFV